MKKFVTTLNILIIIIFFIYAILSFLSVISRLFIQALLPMVARPDLLKSLWASLLITLAPPLFIYGAINFIRKTKNKYNFAFILVLVIAVIGTLAQFLLAFFTKNYNFKITDFLDLILYGILIAVILIAKYLDKKYSIKEEPVKEPTEKKGLSTGAKIGIGFGIFYYIIVFALIILSIMRAPSAEKIAKIKLNLEPKLNPKIQAISTNYKFSFDKRFGYVLGELKNVGNTDYNLSAKVHLISKGKTVATENAYMMPGVIVKNGIVPFFTRIENPPQYDEIKVEAYSFDKSDVASYLECSSLEIISQNPKINNYGQLVIEGDLKNNTGNSYSYGTVCAWLLDANNKVVGISSGTIMEKNANNPMGESEKKIEKGSIEHYETQAFTMDFYQEKNPSYTTIKVIGLGCNRIYKQL